MTTIDSSTLHNRFVTGSQENLQEKETGANSMPTQAPDGEPQKDIVQSSPEEFDADAEVETITVKITYTKKQLFYKLLDNTLKHIINDTDEQDIIFRFL